MILQRILTIPLFFYIEAGLLSRVKHILQQHNLIFNHPIVLCGPTYTTTIAMRLASYMNLPNKNVFKIETSLEEEVAEVRTIIAKRQHDVVIGVGGGKVLDVAKVSAYRQHIPFLSIPTTLSNDGIASPIAVIRKKDQGSHESIGAQMPIGVIIDLEIVKQAPFVTLQAGVGDLISNISAIEDWKFAARFNGERLDSFALLLSQTGVDMFLHKVQKPGLEADLFDEQVLRHLAEGLILSGLAMSVAGTSRPCSGAEHLISHALDRLLCKPRLHGLQVGVATLFVQRLRGQDISAIQNTLNKLKVPTSIKDLDLEMDLFAKAVKLAPSMRPGRATVLDQIESIGEIYRVAEETFSR